MDEFQCPLCGAPIECDHLDRLDCPAGHRYADPDLWRGARMMQLTAEIQQFLEPDASPACPAHRRTVTDVRGELVAARCTFCGAVAVQPTGHDPLSER